MDDKLAALTQKLVDEGIAKADKEATRILAEAREEAERIRREALADAEEERKSAQAEAERLRTRTHSELRLAAEQAMTTSRQALHHLFQTELVDKPVGETLSHPEFLTEALRTVIGQLKIDDQEDVTIHLSPDQADQLKDTLRAGLRDLMHREPVIRALPRIKTGFQISREDQTYRLSFTEADFQAFFTPFLTREIQGILQADEDDQ